MASRFLKLPRYVSGPDCYLHIVPQALRYGSSVVLIGGKKALAAAAPAILEAVDGKLDVLDVLWYGGDATEENAQALAAHPSVQAADLIFGVGGGRAIDLAKHVASKLSKPIFTFPTVASNCAAVTAIGVLYNPDGSFSGYCYPETPDATFINTDIIARSPKELLWAGIGDALSKEAEAVYSSQFDALGHTPLLGVQLAGVCTNPLIQYGKTALAQMEHGRAGHELEEVVLDIIVSTGLVSNLVSNAPDWYYNSSLAHMVYNGYASLGHPGHLHGEVVSLGVLCLLMHAGKADLHQQMMEFNDSLGLPVCFDDIDVTESEFDAIVKAAQGTTEWQFKDSSITPDSFLAMLENQNEAGRLYKQSL